MTNDIERRIFEHKNKLVDGFSKIYSLDKLIYFEIHHQVKDVILREKKVKKWKRQWKINLITENNPDWSDLAIDWHK